MAPVNFPLRWESTGDQWWYASPIDWAAANGSYDIVRELLYLDANLLIKLTSLRRIRRLETVWDDEVQFDDVAKRRADVALKLFRECAAEDAKSGAGGGGGNSLIRAGYGGWLLYTAASAGDVAFVKELLHGDPFLVFGEGEYGVTDVFYAAARSRNGEVFRLLVNSAISLRGVSFSYVGGDKFGEFPDSVLKSEMMNRALHAATRGGFLEMVKEILGQGADISSYRDHQGSTVLHSAAARGQLEVVKDLVASFGVDPMAKDHQGNTAMHVAAYRGHLAVLDLLLALAPSVTVTNNNGDTFLHMAVAGFRTPGFHRIDKQLELLKHVVSGVVNNLRELVNVRNNDGRTALHVALAESVPSELVELLMAVPSIDLNSSDNDGMTPLDLLRKGARSAGSDFLMKHLVSVGGRSSFIDDRTLTNAWVSKLKMQGIMNSPGTSFRIPDAEIFLYTANENRFSDTGTGIEIAEFSRESSAGSKDAASETYSPGPEGKLSSQNNAGTRLKMLFQWAIKKEKKEETRQSSRDDASTEFYKIHRISPSYVSLRQKFSKSSSLPSIKKTSPMTSTLLPSPSTKKKFAAGLLQGVIPQDSLIPKSPSSSVSTSSSLASENNQKREPTRGLDKTSHLNQKGSINSKLMNQYFCFGAYGLAVENTIHPRRLTENHRRAISLAN